MTIKPQKTSSLTKPINTNLSLPQAPPQSPSLPQPTPPSTIPPSPPPPSLSSTLTIPGKYPST